MQEIFPREPTGPPAFISPPLFGALSLRLPSLLAVQNTFPRRNGLVGNSRILLSSVAESFLRRVFGLTGLRNTSAAAPVPKIAIALRSLTEPQILPFWSNAMPSTPSSRGSATKTLSRQRVLEWKVSSHPTSLWRFPSALNLTCHNAPLAVSATKRS